MDGLEIGPDGKGTISLNELMASGVPVVVKVGNRRRFRVVDWDPGPAVFSVEEQKGREFIKYDCSADPSRTATFEHEVSGEHPRRPSLP